MKNILFISPTPTHPQNAGNRIRIVKMVEFFKEQGHEVSFVYSDQESSDIQEMRNYWGKNLYVVSYSQPPKKRQHKWINGFLNKLNGDRQYYSNVDDFYNQNLDNFLHKLITNHTFDVAIAEYIFLSKSLLNFPPSTFKVLDTHDVMTNRHRLFLENGKKPAWYSTTAAQEKKGLDRADCIIAIQNKEKDHFGKLTSKPTVTIGHMVDVHPLKNTTPPRKKILFLGSNNPSNIIGIETFVSKVFPTLRNSIPELELVIAGAISSRVKDQEGIIKMGEMSSLEAIYDLSDIVINPLTIGTGLKIKSIEALGFSKALVSTSVGADGLESGVNSAFLVANTAEEFCKSLNTIISDYKVYLDLCANATKFIEKWNDAVKNELSSLLTSSR
jgi:polysaccharide biosynthesis protein PslH